MNELVVVIMGQDSPFVEMCLRSVVDADKIVYCDGGSKKDYLSDLKLLVHKLEKTYDFEIITQEYSQDDPEMNGKQRNFYLNHLKTNYPGWTCLVLDADEVVDDLTKLNVSKIQGDKLYDVHMRHLIGDFCHEDATREKHFVNNRLFKIGNDISYPLVEHGILRGRPSERLEDIMIWHLAYAPFFHIRDRYFKNLKHSNVHSAEFLHDWYKWHLFGRYPKKEFNPVELPDSVLDFFRIERDELYFENRGLEHKHWIDSLHWKEYFKPMSVLEFGCGRGPRIFTLEQMGVEVKGVELSDWAVEKAFTKRVIQGNILQYVGAELFDLVVAYDLLEHIELNDLPRALEVLRDSCKGHVLISVPAEGDPNLYADKTHKIFKPKLWWERQVEQAGFELISIPNHFLFKHQLIIGRKK